MSISSISSRCLSDNLFFNIIISPRWPSKDPPRLICVLICWKFVPQALAE